METSLHQQLKEAFREPGSDVEVKLGRYRIDVVNGDRLVEIQQSGLAQIRDKVAKLCRDHKVDVVKPLVLRKRLIKLDKQNGRVVGQRWSPKRGTILNLFDELIYFTRVFPHPNLRLIVPMIEVQETRFPGHGRRRRWRKGDFQVQDKELVNIEETFRFKCCTDLHRLLPRKMPTQFGTAEIADGLNIPRWDAQRIAYVLRKTGSVAQVGKKGNALLYELADGNTRSKRKSARKKSTGKAKSAAGKKSKIKRAS